MEKETASWKQRWENSNKALLDMATEKKQRDSDLLALTKQLTQLEKLCRALQTERTALIAQIKNNKQSAIPAIPGAGTNGSAIPDTGASTEDSATSNQGSTNESAIPAIPGAGANKSAIPDTGASTEDSTIPGSDAATEESASCDQESTKDSAVPAIPDTGASTEDSTIPVSDAATEESASPDQGSTKESAVPGAGASTEESAIPAVPQGSSDNLSSEAHCRAHHHQQPHVTSQNE